MADDIVTRLRFYLNPPRNYEPMPSPSHFARPIGQDMCDDANCEMCRLRRWEADRG